MTEKELIKEPSNGSKKNALDDYESIFDYVNDLKTAESPDNFRLNWSKIEEIINDKNK